MAYVVSVTNTSPGTSSSQTPTLPTHLTGDLLLIECVQDGGGTTITPDAASVTAGWAVIPDQAQSGASRSAWVWKVAASGSETSPTITGAADNWAISILVIRDAHASPFGSVVDGTDYKRTSWNAAWNADTGALTTGADDCLLIYGCSMDADNNATVRMRAVPKDMTLVTDYGETTNASTRHMIGYMPAGASGSAAPTVRFWFNNTDGGTQQGGNTWVLAIRNVASGTLQPAVKAGVDVLRFYGHFIDTWGDTWQAPSNFAATINSLSVDTSISAGSANDINNPPGNYTSIASSLNTAGAWVGGSHTITSTNMDGKCFYIQWETASRARIGADGWCVGFSDGTNWALFQLSPQSNTLTIDAPLYNVIALGAGRATALYSSGTINWGAVTRMAYIWHRNESSGTQGVLRIKNAMLVDAAKFVGGGSASNCKFSLLTPTIRDFSYPDIANLQGSGQTLVRQNIQVGDGATDTVFDLSAQSFEYPQAYSASDADKRKFNVLAGAMTVGIYPSASDTLNLTAGIMATAVEQALTVNASASTSATVSTAGSSFVGWTPTWKPGIACNSATFKQCGMIDFKGADIVNVIANEGTDDALISASDGFSATGCTFTASATAVYGIRIAAAGTISLDGTVFNDFTKDIDVTATTGTVTINLAAGQATPTYQTAGATVTIVADPVFQSVALSGFVAGSLIQIYDTEYTFTVSGVSVYPAVGDVYSQNGVDYTVISAGGGSIAVYGVTISEASGTLTRVSGSGDASITFSAVADDGTQLFCGTASAGNTVISGSTCTWTDPNPATAKRHIRARVGRVSGATAKLLVEAIAGICGTASGTESVSLIVAQENDPSYNANAVDGPAIYATSGITFTDSATDLVNCNISGGSASWATIYACFVHWCSNTTTGIANDISYIDSPDPANYILTRTKVKNTGSGALTLTGGYYRDRVTGLSVTATDLTGGFIFPSVEHVVGYATASGLTAGQDAALMALPSATANAAAVLAAATTTPIAANVKKMNDTALQGDGTESDKFRSVLVA